jgi:hypothetical protein
MRKLATIVEIESAEPIANTEAAFFSLKGRNERPVASANAFSPSDLAIYIEDGSILPKGDNRYGGVEMVSGIKVEGVQSNGLLLSLGNFVGKEILFSTRPATLDDITSEDGKPVTQADIEGLEVADLHFFKQEDGKTVRVEVREGTDLTELLGIKEG